MCHGIDHDVDPHRVSPFLGECLEVLPAFSFAFPSITEIRVVTDHHHHAAIVVKKCAIMDFFRIWPFIGDSISHPVVNARYLRLLFEVVDEVEDGVFKWQIDRLTLRENPLHLNVKVVPSTSAVNPENFGKVKEAVDVSVLDTDRVIVADDPDFDFG